MKGNVHNQGTVDRRLCALSEREKRCIESQIKTAQYVEKHRKGSDAFLYEDVFRKVDNPEKKCIIYCAKANGNIIRTCE